MCKVSFSIGEYQDEICCDVVEMDACHLLFGRTWQFDQDVWHLGNENVYRLNKVGKRFTLFALKSGSHPKVKHKVRMQNDVAVASGRRLNLLLMRKDEIMGVHKLQDRVSKFLERSCI